jgi:hypothetical protein
MEGRSYINMEEGKGQEKWRRKTKKGTIRIWKRGGTGSERGEVRESSRYMENVCNCTHTKKSPYMQHRTMKKAIWDKPGEVTRGNKTCRARKLYNLTFIYNELLFYQIISNAKYYCIYIFANLIDEKFHPSISIFNYLFTGELTQKVIYHFYFLYYK